MATVEINANPKAFGTVLYYAFMECYVQKNPREIVPWELLAASEQTNWTEFAKVVLRKAIMQ